MNRFNEQIANRLEETASLLRDQGADPFRVRAYRGAAATIRFTPESVDAVFERDGLEGLKRLPGVGDSIAHAIRELLVRGHLPMLDRLRGEAAPHSLLTTIPGIGRVLDERLRDELGIETLTDLEAAAYDGRLATVKALGRKRLAGIRDSLAQRLGRVRTPPPTSPPPSVHELLDIDREYRTKAAANRLPRIAPRRFNPAGEAWLPILHTRRGPAQYTVLFSNTPRAHRHGKTHDWVVIYGDHGGGERRHTVITAEYGPLKGRRVVAGREAECETIDPSAGLPRRPPRPSLRRVRNTTRPSAETRESTRAAAGPSRMARDRRDVSA